MHMLYIFLGFAFFLCVNKLHVRRGYRSVCEYCDAEDAFKSWRESNPYVYIGLSNKGKKLLSELILAYDFFLKMHPYVDGKSTREYLLSLFDDLPPRPHKPTPLIYKRSPDGDFFVYCHYRRNRC
jgi:hypothetical protein